MKVTRFYRGHNLLLTAARTPGGDWKGRYCDRCCDAQGETKGVYATPEEAIAGALADAKRVIDRMAA